jgi:hypothetical protein
MGGSATPVIAAMAATALIACGSTTTTSAEPPRGHDTATVAEPAPDEPVAPPDASPPAAPSVTLAALADAMKPTSAYDVIDGLGELGLTAQCPTEGWTTGPAGALETASCPAGPVQLGDVHGVLEVVVSRRIDDASTAAATVIITATGDRDEWRRRARVMLLRARNAVDEVAAVAGEPLPHFVPLGGQVRAHFRDDNGEPLRLVLARHSGGGLLR